MASSESSLSVSLVTPLSSSPMKENLVPTQSKIAELNESRSELFGRIQSLKQDLQNWRSKLDTQVKGYRIELTELKKSLHVEVEQLRSEFQELKTTLQHQQEEVTASLKNLGLQDPSTGAAAVPDQGGFERSDIVEENGVEISTNENDAEASAAGWRVADASAIEDVDKDKNH